MQNQTDIEVLREMVRLAERRRAEALESIERINKYNLALIAFAGSFLSLLITTNADLMIIRVVGAVLMCCIACALIAIRPERVQGSISIEDDIAFYRQGNSISLGRYLLEVADATNITAAVLNQHAARKKGITIISALFLAFSLVIAYILHGYA